MRHTTATARHLYEQAQTRQNRESVKGNAYSKDGGRAPVATLHSLRLAWEKRVPVSTSVDRTVPLSSSDSTLRMPPTDGRPFGCGVQRDVACTERSLVRYGGGSNVQATLPVWYWVVGGRGISGEEGGRAEQVYRNNNRNHDHHRHLHQRATAYLRVAGSQHALGVLR